MMLKAALIRMICKPHLTGQVLALACKEHLLGCMKMDK